jgi:hypothetical protein
MSDHTCTVFYLLGCQRHKYHSKWWLGGGIHPEDVLGAYQSVQMPSFDKTLINLNDEDVNPLTAPVQVNWNPQNGWRGVSTNGYFDTGINWRETYSLIVKFTRPQSGDSVLGVIDGANGVDVHPSEGANSHYCRWAAQSNSHAPKYDREIMAICGRNLYINGNLHFTFNSATFTLTRNLYLMARNNGGTADLFYNGNVHAFAMYNKILTQQEVIGVTSSIQSVVPL